MADDVSAVLFDMDGVLVDSEDFWVERERERILPAVVEEDVPVREITGMNYREIYDYLDREYEVRVEEEEFVDLFQETATEIYSEHASIMPGAEGLLADLRERGCALALVSSSPHDWIDMVLDRFDVAFDAVVSAEDIDGPGKPDPAIYEYAAERVDAVPEECVAVEDSEHGVAAASAAGTTCVGYRTAVNRDVDLSEADVVAEGPDELRRVLLDLC